MTYIELELGEDVLPRGRKALLKDMPPKFWEVFSKSAQRRIIELETKTKAQLLEISAFDPQI